jgi:hypothetical protein
MAYFHPYYFENLKKQILKTSGFTNLIPANCRTISTLIEVKTRQKISETTLKRVFGFAFSKFQPSLFTLDVMARFCDYRSWSDFCENQEELSTRSTYAETPVANVAKNTLGQNAGKITQFTLQALKNKSGVPYYQTIKRKFIDDHFDLFLNGPYNATILAAPTGYGKTIALCHWIEERLIENTEKNNDDNVLFFSLNALMNVFFTGRDLNEWLLALLGYSSDQDIISFLEMRQNHKGYFILVIDGLDDHTFKNDQFQLLLSQIIDIFSFYKNYPWFKLVLTMRSATLISYRHYLEYDQPNWFKGFITDEDEVTNVPLLNISEIKRLCTKINPNVTHVVDIEIVKKINYPLYFQFYYKSHKDDFTLRKIDQLHMYEVIATFILNKIYLGPNSSEKILLINALLEKMDFKTHTYTINKIDFDSQIKHYKQSYQELLGIGYIKEINNSSNFNYVTDIHFGNKDFLAYTLAKRLLDTNDLIFNDKLINSLNDLFGAEPIKLFVLKWCIIYALKSGQSIDFTLLYTVDINPNEKSDLLNFLGDVLKKDFSISKNNEGAGIFVKLDNYSGIFNYFLGLEFINPEYKKTLSALMNLGICYRGKIKLHCSLAIIAIIEMDINHLEEQLNHLRKFSAEELQVFPINPLVCLETIYYYLKYGIIKREAFVLLTKFYFNPLPNSWETTYSTNNSDMLNLLGVYTLTVCKKPNKILKLINAIKKAYRSETGPHYGYNYLLKVITTEATLSLPNKLEEGLKLYSEVTADYEQHKNSYTPFMRASYYLLKLKVNTLTAQHDDIFDNIQTLLNLADQYGYKLIKLNCLIFILENQASLKVNTDFYKLIYYDFIKIIRESGFRGESFVSNNGIMADIS